MIGKIRGQWRAHRSQVAALCLSFGAAACFAQEKPDDLKALQKERRELLSEVATGMYKIYLQSLGTQFLSPSLQEVAQAERDSFKADLDYFDKPEERIEAIEKHKKAADSLLEIAEGHLRTARGNRLGVFQAKAYILEIQIELVKEKKKQGK